MSSTEFYSHLHVGDVQFASLDFLTKSTISFPFKTTSSVYSTLLSLHDAGKTYEEIFSAAGTMKTSEDVFDSFIDFKDDNLDFMGAIDWLSNSPNFVDANTYLGSLSTIASLKIWDSIMVHHIINKEKALASLLYQVLKVLKIKEKIGSGDITNTAQLKKYWKNILIVLPKPIFPLPFKEREDTGGTGSVVSGDQANLRAEITALTAARDELTRAFDKQLTKLKATKLTSDSFVNNIEFGRGEEFNAPKPITLTPNLQELYQDYLSFKEPEFLTTQNISQLGQSAQSSLSNSNINLQEISVPDSLQMIEHELTQLRQRLNYSKTVKYVTNIGSVFVEIDMKKFPQTICDEQVVFDHCALITELDRNNPDNSLFQILGMGYVNVIKQELLRYESGEIAHIETVLQGESKSKKHRNLSRTETSLSTFSSSSSETETDQRSSDRFELDKQVSKISSASSDLSAGVDVSASYGPVTVSAGLDYSSSSASTEAASQATNIAKELTTRAVSRIRESFEERKKTSTLNEIEVTNDHGIDNKAGIDHINGFYYWVNKVYTQQVMNKGKRLMLEFMVPEPAAFHIYANGGSTKEGVNIQKPIPPAEYNDDLLTGVLTSFQDITRDNYFLWGGVYDAQDLPIPPSEYETVSGTLVLDPIPEGKAWHDIATNNFTVPAGYKASYGKLNIGFSSDGNNYISGFLGNKMFTVYYSTPSPLTLYLDGERDLVPLSFRGHFVDYIMNIEVLCSLTEQKFQEWQKLCYQAILAAYNQKKTEYDDSITFSEISRGVLIEGDNPLTNRETEKTELKRWALELLTLQRFGRFNGMKNAKNGHPEMDFNAASEDGKYVRFFEQAIEWQNMTYVFYPYFWGRKPSWTIAKSYDDTDPLFSKFLQAGYARVVVPVHPKFTQALLHYVKSGEIWLGQDLPGLDDELYLSIVEEIKESQDSTEDTPIGEPWEITLPTNLVMLTGNIPGNLPGSET